MINIKKFVIFLILLLCDITLFAQLKSPLDGGILGLTLSPDGRTIVFASPTWKLPFSNLISVDVKTGKLQNLLDGVLISYPKFSPDGKRIVFIDNYGEIKSCNIKGENLISHTKLSSKCMIHDLCFTSDGKSIYFVVDSITKQAPLCQLYKLNIENNNVECVSETDVSGISGLGVYKENIIFNIIQKDKVKKSKIFLLEPSNENTITELILSGEIDDFVLPKYHKSTNQLIICRRSKFYKVDMKNKKVKLFFHGKNRRFMCYDISQKENKIYFFEVGIRKIFVINFEGKNIGHISI